MKDAGMEVLERMSRGEISAAEASIEGRVALDFVRYANCWEDADVLCEALRPAAGQRMLSIASAGDNALALLAAGAEVVAVDLSAVQLACLELRACAFRRLEYEEVLGFLGVRAARDRVATYRRLAGELSEASRRHWDRSLATVARGVIHGGKLEAYFDKFRRWVLPLIHGRGTIERLMAPKSREERREFWQRTFNNRRWRLLFRLFFGRAAMGRLGRDPEFFRYVEGSVAERFMARAEYALTELPTESNPYLTYIVYGNFGEALPRYLRREHFEAIRAGLARLRVVRGSIDTIAQEQADDGFDGFNLSDIFEYLDEGAAAQVYRRLLDTARPGARLAYWNTLVPRSCPARLAPRVRRLAALSDELFGRDQAFFYSAFHVDETAADENC
jgi:S-adenosylmethionine-diacylglycerol 3-amino-3-carboxypropyl transferase